MKVQYTVSQELKFVFTTHHQTGWIFFWNLAWTI